MQDGTRKICFKCVKLWESASYLNPVAAFTNLRMLSAAADSPGRARLFRWRYQPGTAEYRGPHKHKKTVLNNNAIRDPPDIGWQVHTGHLGLQKGNEERYDREKRDRGQQPYRAEILAHSQGSDSSTSPSTTPKEGCKQLRQHLLHQLAQLEILRVAEPV